MSTGAYVAPLYIRILWLTLVGGAVFGALRADWSSVFISLATLGLMIYGIRLSRTIDFNFPQSFITATIIFIYATLFLGEVGGFYERLWWWDTLLHMGSAIGFGLVGFTVLLLLFRTERVGASPVLISIFSFFFALGIGVLWEIFEFLMDIFFGLNMQKSGLADTMGDFIVNTAGALIASIAGYYYLTRKSDWGLGSVIKEAVRANLKRK